MTMTECLTSDFLSRNTYAVALMLPYSPWTALNERRSFPDFIPAELSSQINFVCPVGKEKGSCQTTVIIFPGEREEFIPYTALGKKLVSLRNRAIASGMRLLSEDEVLEEVKRRRGESENDEADVY